MLPHTNITVTRVNEKRADPCVREVSKKPDKMTRNREDQPGTQDQILVWSEGNRLTHA